ncbi:MAG: hypothetical protein M1822_006189 [Bathelium mastoideum]|nr:MAG: hypothetical protein M1822_006189 [Bathelium mastoideum]
MPMWPFGRRGRRSKVKQAGPQPVADGKKAAPASYESRPGPLHAGDPQIISSRPSQRSRRTSTKDSASQKNVRRNQTEPLPSKGSVENITALPVSRGLGISPHLRPVTQDLTDVPYNFRQGVSGTDTPTSEKRGKLQRPTKLQSRSETNVQRRKSSRKRRSDPAREEEIRLMSKPIPIPKRGSAQDSGILRRESKKSRNHIGRQTDRPDSNVSLPLEDSIHSSMSGISEQRTFIVHGFDAFSPRPRLRYSSSPQFAPGSHHSHHSAVNIIPQRSDSKKEKAQARTVTRETLKESRTIDDLADDLDAGGLRALMERDQRRQDKKRKQEEEKARRRLQRRAEKQALQEQRRQRGESSPARSQHSTRGREERKGVREPIGLGLEQQATQGAKEDLVSKEEKEVRGPATEVSPTDTPMLKNGTPQNPFTDATETQAAPAVDQEQPTGKAVETPMHTPLEAPLESPVEEPKLETAQAVRLSQASIQHTPPVSPEQTRAPSRLSQTTDLRHASTPDVPTPPAEPAKRKAPAELSSSPSRRVGTWTSFFRRGTNAYRKREPENKGPPSEVSFSNTSRESMRAQIPAHLQHQPSERRRSSGTPHRTQSRFREELPEMPLSPPDSRRQSPEVTALPPISRSVERPVVAAAAAAEPKVIGGGSSRASPGDTMMSQRTDSPVSPPPGRSSSALMSQSLASVDSEASWLSGKPSRRTSKQARSSHRLSSGESPEKRPRSDDYSASYEELGIPEDEYFRRLTPAAEEDYDQMPKTRRSSHKASSQALGGAESVHRDRQDHHGLDQTLLRAGSERRPTVVERSQRVKSSEGLLNQFHQGQSAEEDYATPSQSPSKGLANIETNTADSDSNYDEADSPLEEHQPVEIKRAESVDLKHHSRHASTGSARLLELPKRGDSKRTSRASSTGLSSNPASPMTASFATFSNPTPGESNQ